MMTNQNKGDASMTHIRVNATPDYHIEALVWLEHNISKDTWNYDVTWPSSSVIYRFQRPRDAVLFQLRWAK